MAYERFTFTVTLVMGFVYVDANYSDTMEQRGGRLNVLVGVVRVIAGAQWSNRVEG